MDIKEYMKKRIAEKEKEKNPTFSYKLGKLLGNTVSILISAIIVLFLIWVVMSLGAAIIAPFR